MNISFSITSVYFSVFILILFSSCINSYSSNYSGHAGILHDSTIYDFDFKNEKINTVLEKNQDFLISSFDILQNDKFKVLVIYGGKSVQNRLLLLSENKTRETILEKSFIRYPSVSPDGKHIAYLTASEDSNGNKYIKDWYVYLTNIDGALNKKIMDIPVGKYKPSWLPDGNNLVVTSKDLSIYIVNISTGKYQKLIDHGLAPSVSNSGKLIAYLSDVITPELKARLVEYISQTKDDYIQKTNEVNGESVFSDIENLYIKNSIFIFDIGTKEIRMLVPSKKSSIENRAIWSPDDKFLIYNDERMLNHDIYIADTSSGEIEEIQNINGRVMYWH